MIHSSKMTEIFHKIATFTSRTIGSPSAFVIALILIILWAVSGPLFKYSDAWQLSINTSTTIITFLVVFLIQATQNRDSHALHLKLDELLRSNKNAHNQMIGIELLTEAEVRQLQEQIQIQIANKKEAKYNRKMNKE